MAGLLLSRRASHPEGGVATTRPASWQARGGTGLIAAGLALLAYAALWTVGLAPGSRVTLPAPVALERPAASSPGSPGQGRAGTAVEPSAARNRAGAPAGRGSADQAHAPRSGARATAGSGVPLVPADRGDRLQWSSSPAPGYATRLAIPAIRLRADVVQGGVQLDASGEPQWETRPFVAVHYGDLTALVGAVGNAVIAGHVATLYEGNVFQNLYRVQPGDEVDVWDESDTLHRFAVEEVKLVAPSDTSVMEPTDEPTLTLITCGGTFDPVRREFSDRLIVVAKPLATDALGEP